MVAISGKVKRFFKEAGRRGGQRRARGLSAVRRQAIARGAALARWKKSPQAEASLPSVRLHEARWSDPVYLQEVLSFGTLSDWRLLHRRLQDRPFGPEAQSLEKVCRFSTLYGAVPLWSNILRTLQGGR